MEKQGIISDASARVVRAEIRVNGELLPKLNARYD
jgi:hypothetical protein